ncbi:unnamed protein product [Closterium sp. NIES-65]|nr:unnamed protein product [Closterium sp. NIES-65]
MQVHAPFPPFTSHPLPSPLPLPAPSLPPLACSPSFRYCMPSPLRSSLPCAHPSPALPAHSPCAGPFSPPLILLAHALTSYSPTVHPSSILAAHPPCTYPAFPLLPSAPPVLPPSLPQRSSAIPLVFIPHSLCAPSFHCTQPFPLLISPPSPHPSPCPRPSPLPSPFPMPSSLPPPPSPHPFPCPHPFPLRSSLLCLVLVPHSLCAYPSFPQLTPDPFTLIRPPALILISMTTVQVASPPGKKCTLSTQVSLSHEVI